MNKRLRRLSIVLGGSLLSILGVANFSSLIRLLGPKIYPEAVFRLDCDRNLAALTIDDGPFPSSTAQILQVLQDHNVKATFFAIGERGQQNPELLQAIADQGHELANHTYAERTTARLDEPELSSSIADTHNLLTTYQQPQWFRPGTGFYNDKILQAIEPYGYQLALGDVFPFDTVIPSSAFYAWYINHSIQPGSIIVLHDANGRGERAANALATVLPKLKARGYGIVPLRELAEACQA